MIRNSIARLPGLLFLLSMIFVAGTPDVRAQVDLLGNYVFLRTQCFDEASGNAVGEVTFANYTETLQINGNGFVRTITGGNCTAVNSGTITFNPEGTYSAPESPISVAAGSCSILTEFSITIGDAVRESGMAAIDFINGGTFAAAEGAFIRADGLLLLELADITLVENDICFDVYQVAPN